MITSAIGNLPVVGYQDQELHNLEHHDLYIHNQRKSSNDIYGNLKQRTSPTYEPIIETNKNLCILFIIKKIIESQQHMKRINFRYIDNQ